MRAAAQGSMRHRLRTHTEAATNGTWRDGKVLRGEAEAGDERRDDILCKAATAIAVGGLAGLACRHAAPCAAAGGARLRASSSRSVVVPYIIRALCRG